MFTSTKKIFKLGWINFRRQGGLSIATVFIMVLTIFLITSLFIFQKAANLLITDLQEKVDISVYFKETSTEEEILGVKEDIALLPEVKDVQYTSRDAALETFVEKHKDEPILIESIMEIGKNPLLASLNIKAGQASQYDAIAGFLEKAPFKDLIEKVDYYQRKPIIERIFSISSAVSRGGILLSIVLAIIAFLVAFNQVRMAIYSSREEISIQRLVGASNWFIRGPFLAEGVISGFFATLIALLVIFPLLFFFGSKSQVLFPGFDLFHYFTSNFFLILLIQFTAGIGLGTVSSLIAIRKYLEV